MKDSSYLRYLLYFGIALCFVMFFYIGPQVVLHKVLAAPAKNILIAVFFYFLILILGLIRWYILLNFGDNKASLKPLAEVYFLNCFVSNLTPARSGDVLAPKLLADHCNLSVTKSAAAIILDRSSDLFTLLILVILSTIWLSKNYDFQLITIARTTNIAFIFIPIVVFGLITLKIFAKSDARPVASIRFFVQKTWQSLKGFKSPVLLATVFLLSLINWLLHFFKEFFMFTAFIKISFIQLAVCQSITNLISLLTFIPGGLGVNIVSNSFLVARMGLDWQGAATSTIISTILFTSIRMILGVVFNRRLFRNISH